MPFVGTEYFNVSGASSAAPGQTVQSAVWNAIHIDYESALTQINSQYANVASNRNILWMNGGLEVWQRGAGASASINVASPGNAYTADRWYLKVAAGQNSTVAAQPGLVDQSYRCARVRRTASQNGTDEVIFGYPLDTEELIRLRGTKAALSLILRGGSTFSAASVTIELIVGTGAVQKSTGGYTGATTPISVATAVPAGQSIILSTTSTTVPVNITQAEVRIRWNPVGTAGIDDSLSIDDVQMEAVASAFGWSPMGYDRLPFEQMLQGCKKHYAKTFDYDQAPATATTTMLGDTLNPPSGCVGQFVYGNGNPVIFEHRYEVEMRLTTPAALVVFNPILPANTLYNGGLSLASLAYAHNGKKGFGIYFNNTTGFATTNNVYGHFTIDCSIQ